MISGVLYFCHMHFFLIGSIYDSDNDCGKKIADSYKEYIYVLDIKCKTD